MRIPLAAILLASGLACHPAPRTIQWARAYLVVPIGASPAVFYGRIINGTDRPDTLLSISTDAARETQLHASMTETMGGRGTMTMTPVDRVAVAAHSVFVLAPGGYHAMMNGLRPDLKAGDSITVVAHLAHAGAVTAHAAVITYADVDTATASERSR